MTTQEFNKRLDEILYDYWARHRHCDSGCKVESGNEITTHALKELFGEVIGDELTDDDGWDHYFSDEAKCCPGDDFAHYGNKIKSELRTIIGVER